MNFYAFILSYISLIIYIFVIIKCYLRYKKYELCLNLKKYIILIICPLFVMVNNLYVPKMISVFISFLILFVIIFLWFNEKSKDVFIFTILFYSLIIIIEIVLSLIFGMFSVSNLAELNNNLLIKFLFNIMEFLIIYFIFYFNFVINLISYVNNYFKNKSIVNYLYIFLLLVIIFGISFSKDYDDYLLFIIIVISTISFILLSIDNNRIKSLSETLELRNKDLQECIVKYEVLSDDFRVLKHNINNDLIAIRESPKEYSEKLISDKINKNNKDLEYFNNINKIPIGIRGMVFSKYHIIKKNNINLKVDSNLKKTIIEEFNYKKYDSFMTAFGIAFDNAIESSIKSENKIIYIDVCRENELLSVTITNEFVNSIDINKLGKKNYSSKKNKSGVGLNYIMKLKSKIKTKIVINNNLYSICISMKMSNNKKQLEE